MRVLAGSLLAPCWMLLYSVAAMLAITGPCYTVMFQLSPTASNHHVAGLEGTLQGTDQLVVLLLAAPGCQLFTCNIPYGVARYDILRDSFAEASCKHHFHASMVTILHASIDASWMYS
ncbi:hypothetical protein V8C86DRAFT_2848033 [Haematococcus lacustris]